MNPAELHIFFEDIVRKLRARGVVCGITSGLACVHYGLAETTKDCDLLCHASSFPKLLDLLAETKVECVACQYRGNISPPLDERWHKGGWTSHFTWDLEGEPLKLDVFGRAVRQSGLWENELSGLYAGRNIVAEMKRTDRPKDWPFITSLGAEMLRERDARGWLHIFDADFLLQAKQNGPIPDDLIEARPVLRLAVQEDPNLRQALGAEERFWRELDRMRIGIYRQALRPFVVAVGRKNISSIRSLPDQHLARVACAEETLQKNPIASFGIEKMIEQARASTEGFVRPELMAWLPNVQMHFKYLFE